MFADIDITRAIVAAQTTHIRKAELGQFLTPFPIAQFMASLFRPPIHAHCHLLDAGAGIGSLCAAFLERARKKDFSFRGIEIDAFEIDDRLRPILARTLDEASSQHVKTRIIGGDFVLAASDFLNDDLFSGDLRRYSHAILNPPYKKIHSDSPHRIALAKTGIQVVNMYAAFVALAVELLEESGQLVAIIPRSFCNGRYYRPFRDFLLSHGAIQHLHLFNARDKAFKDENVLQENLIMLFERGGRQREVVVSNSTDDKFADYSMHTYPFSDIVQDNDPERFIRIPATPALDFIEESSEIKSTLTDLDIEVSTGPVVDFRLRQFIRDLPESNTVPLLYPSHFSGAKIEWPKPKSRKPNAIIKNTDTERWLYPNDFYVVTRRFSSKEEKRRIVASIVDPAAFPKARSLGFENHLNIFHCHGKGLSQELAWGLMAFLNTSALDVHFRRFSGHTQVNATDLRQIKYPSRAVLLRLGKWAKSNPDSNQIEVDAKVESLLR